MPSCTSASSLFRPPSVSLGPRFLAPPASSPRLPASSRALPRPARPAPGVSENPERSAAQAATGRACAGAGPARPPVGSSSSEPRAAAEAAPPRRPPASWLLPASGATGCVSARWGAPGQGRGIPPAAGGLSEWLGGRGRPSAGVPLRGSPQPAPARATCPSPGPCPASHHTCPGPGPRPLGERRPSASSCSRPAAPPGLGPGPGCAPSRAPRAAFASSASRD